MDLSIKTFLADDGAEIKYVDEGYGVPFLYFYGMGSSIASQELFIKFVAEHFRCICMDMRAFGLTEAVGEISLSRVARDGKQLLEYLGINKAIIMGYSMGAAVMFSFLEQFGCDSVIKILVGDMSPKLINEDGWNMGLYQGWYTREMFEQDLETMKTDYKKFALILAEQILFKRNADESRDFSGSAEEIRERILARKPHELLTEGLMNGLVDISEGHVKANYDYWKTMAGADFRDLLKKITVPAGLLHARPGSCYSPEVAEYMSREIPNAVLMPMWGCTHLAAGEDAKQWRKYILDFCME